MDPRFRGDEKENGDYVDSYDSEIKKTLIEIAFAIRDNTASLSNVVKELESKILESLAADENSSSDFISDIVVVPKKTSSQ